MPNQPGRFVRDCDQAKTHGIARSAARSGAAAVPPRAAGRDPMLNAESSPMGVAERKKSAKSTDSQTSSRYARRAVCDSSSMTASASRGRLPTPPPPSPHAAAAARAEGRRDRRIRQLLKVAQRDVRVDVAVRDHLPLLGQLEPSVDRPFRLGDDGTRHRTSATADRASAAVEQRQLDLMATSKVDERFLRAVEHPCRREGARFLGGVGVTEHHLLAVAAIAQVRAVCGRRGAARRRFPPLPRAHRQTRRAARRRTSADRRRTPGARARGPPSRPEPSA